MLVRTSPKERELESGSSSPWGDSGVFVVPGQTHLNSESLPWHAFRKFILFSIRRLKAFLGKHSKNKMRLPCLLCL